VDRLAAVPALDAGMLERKRAEEPVEHLPEASDVSPERNPARSRLYTRFTAGRAGKAGTASYVGIASDALGETKFAAGDDDGRASDLNLLDPLG
jgi:hypothetical protein